MGLPSGAFSTSSQTLYLKVKASKKLDSSRQLLPVSFLPVPSNKQYLFLLLQQWKPLCCFLVNIINLWPSFLITRYQLLLPTTLSACPCELIFQRTFSIFLFKPFLYTLQTVCNWVVAWLHTKCIFDWLFMGKIFFNFNEHFPKVKI